MQWFIYFVFNRGQLMEAVWRSHTKTMMASCFAPPTWLLPWNMLKHFCFNRFCCWKDSAPNPAHPTHAHLMITSVTDFFKHFLSQESHDNQPLHRWGSHFMFRDESSVPPQKSVGPFYPTSHILMIFQGPHPIQKKGRTKKMRACTNLILIHYSSFRDMANAAFKEHWKAKITQN